jgi:quercetin dioxygenase-like cupin family protein
MESTPFAEALLPTRRDAIAPDGSQVRLLVRLPGGSMAHFELGPGEISRPMQHRTVSEAWYILQGLGRMWRRQDGTEREIDLRPGTALTIPVGTAFQFHNTAGRGRGDDAALARRGRGDGGCRSLGAAAHGLVLQRDFVISLVRA